jgi:nitrogen regulatory protein PII
MGRAIAIKEKEPAPSAGLLLSLNCFLGKIQSWDWITKIQVLRSETMKLIHSIIRPHRLQYVKEALSEIGIAGLTVTDVRGAGRQKGQVERYRGSEYNINLLAKCKIEVAVTDDQCEEVIQAIRKSAYSGEIGDGKIFILQLEDAMRIRTGERGEDSL